MRSMNTTSLESLADRYERGNSLEVSELERLYLNGKHLLTAGAQRRIQQDYYHAKGILPRSRVVSGSKQFER
jgi:hypothetical protein